MAGRSVFFVHREWIVVLAAVAIFLGCGFSPPSLMDDVDAVQAQIARNMLESGDWVTARLNGVAYLEKPPLKYWMMAVSYQLFGVRDWAARLPVLLCAVMLCWVTARFGGWAFGGASGLFAGLALSTCVGLFLFTRVLISDVMLTLAVTVAMYAFMRIIDEQETRPRRWAVLMGACAGAGCLLKGLTSVVIPAGAILLYLVVTRQLFSAAVWRRLHIGSCAAAAILAAAPWMVLATLRNPPYFDFTLRSEPGQYRGFFWFFFINEHLLRFLNLRYPRDYNTVPLLSFYLYHLLWLFPWSAYLPATIKLGYRPADRAGRARLLALCWIAFVLLFFTFSTTQEYYSMPSYPALALLLGCALAQGGSWIRRGTKFLALLSSVGAVVAGALYWQVRHVPTPGDISTALTQNPEMYTLALGHAHDLTLASLAYLRAPLLLAGAAALVGGAGAWLLGARKALAAVVLMMVLFTHAARLALVKFDPYLGSRPLAEALRNAPPGEVIFDNQYYVFSSVFYYAGVRGLLLNGRVNNLEYGSYAPDAPDVFIDDQEFAGLWKQPERRYLLVEGPAVQRIESLVGRERLVRVASSGGKFLFTNQGRE